ncbi:hypothetical protein EVAR_44316_1 [Eumeta japonica]|uniref:Uncharacterized protein n=1 Tax=Eumeta variegata TaxID=151549 RepID=A0A4C1XBG0_EUMVA|nr:hypothetical protein EVAR_44316_1 [Eumeta japonica]
MESLSVKRRELGAEKCGNSHFHFARAEDARVTCKGEKVVVASQAICPTSAQCAALAARTMGPRALMAAGPMMG